MSPASATPASRPELPRLVVLLVSLAAGFLVIAGLRGLSSIVGPVFMAFVLVIATQPLRTAMVRRGLPVWLGGVVAIVTIYLILIALTLSMAWAVTRFATLLPSYESEANRMLDSAVAWLASQGVGEAQLQKLAGGLDVGRLVSLAGSVASSLLALLTSLFLVVTLVLFMAADSARFSAKLRRTPAGHEQLVEALTHFGVATRRYLVVSTVFGLIVAVFDTIALAWLGIPVAVLWGLLAFITNYIPNVGFVIGVIPPAVIGLLEGGPRLMVTVIVVYSVLNVLIQSVIQPKIVGDAVGLSSTITMISLVFWAYTLGAVGALLAVPLTLFAKALLIDADPRSQWLIPLMSGAAPGKPPWKGPRHGRKVRRARRARAAQGREGAR
jgi:predicted PurR-regulated permease PerM